MRAWRSVRGWDKSAPGGIAVRDLPNFFNNLDRRTISPLTLPAKDAERVGHPPVCRRGENA